ncbi:MAG: hypothetical protein RJQ08_01460 [Salinisphaeraceae bacterium]
MPRFSALILLAFSSVAAAGGTATIEVTGDNAAGGNVTMHWQDAENVRIDPPNQPAYMLLRGGKAYTVMSTGGRTMVMDLASISNMPGGGPGGMGSPDIGGTSAISRATAVSDIDATGQRETVAGIEGEIYTVTWTDADGSSHSGEAVLSDDATVVEMSQAFGGFIEAMAAIGNNKRAGDAINEKLAAEGLGVLRFENQFRLAEISDETPSADTFELPAKPMNLQDMMKGMQPSQ